MGALLDTRWLRVVMISPGRGELDALMRCATEAAAGGVRALQIREPGLSARELLAWGRALRRIWPRGTGALLVNDRVDVAAGPDFDGVQLGWRSLDSRRARQLLGAEKWIGASIHREEEMDLDDSANFYIFGPVHDTPSKRGLVRPRGIARLAAAVEQASRPLVAIGGVDAGNAASVAATGAAGIAVIRALDDPHTARVSAAALSRVFES